jgi:hypothetical protein
MIGQIGQIGQMGLDGRRPGVAQLGELFAQPDDLLLPRSAMRVGEVFGRVERISSPVSPSRR